MKNRVFGNGNGSETKTDTRSAKAKEVPSAKYRAHSKKALDYEYYVARMLRKFGPLISIGKLHWRWNDYIWKLIDFDKFRKFAVDIQPPGQKSCVGTENILKMLSNMTQAQEDIKWQNACRFNGEKDLVMISVANGVVKLTAVNSRIELVEPDRKDLVISQLPIDYDAKAKCPTFDYLLSSALPHAEDRYMLQCFIGYCLLPDHRFQCVLYCYGAPNSGKSLLILHALGSMFSDDLISSVSLDDICKGGDGLRSLENSLVNISTEINSRKLEDSSIFNQIACGEPLNKALKWEKDRKLISNAKHIFIGNGLPKWDRGSEAQVRRIKILFFPNDFSKQIKDGSLEKNVKLEASGIFNWALEGLKEVLRLEQMPSGSDDSQFYASQFKKHNNPLETFHKLFFEENPKAKTKRKDYEHLFKFWVETEGISVSDNMLFNPCKLLKKLYPKMKIGEPTRIKGEACRAIFGLDLNANGVELMKLFLQGTQ